MQKKHKINATAFHTEDAHISVEVTLSKNLFYLVQLLRDYLTRLIDGRIFLSNMNYMREFHIKSRRGTPCVVQPVMIV